MHPGFRKLSVAIAVCAATTAGAQTYYGNGYTIVEGTDSGQLASDLDAKVFKTINAYSVEDGLRQLLAGSGWELAQPMHADPQIWRLYRQPWPDNKRTISPMPLGEALSWIAGDGWILVADPVNRLISFEVAPRYAHAALPARPTTPPSAAAPATSPMSTTAYGNDVYADIPPGSSQPSLQVPYGSSYGTSSYTNSYPPSSLPLTTTSGGSSSNSWRDQHYAVSNDGYSDGQTYFADTVTQRSAAKHSSEKRETKTKERKERTALRPKVEAAAAKTSVMTKPVTEKKAAAKTPTTSKESTSPTADTTKTAVTAKDGKLDGGKKATTPGNAATDKATAKSANNATERTGTGKETAAPPHANKTATENTAANLEKQP